MPINVGDRLPDATFQIMGADGPTSKTTAELFGAGKVAVFALPGAFTPTCSAQHLPGFVANAEALHAKGVGSIVCLSVNDVFVMNAWGKDQGVGDKVIMAADGAGAFARAIGLTLDTADFGGERSQRYSMLVEDGVVRVLNVEDGGGFSVSSAEHLLTQV